MRQILKDSRKCVIAAIKDKNITYLAAEFDLNSSTLVLLSNTTLRNIITELEKRRKDLHGSL